MSKTEQRYKNAVVKINIPEQAKSLYFHLEESFGLTGFKTAFEKYAVQGDRAAFSQKINDDKTISAFSINRAIPI